MRNGCIFKNAHPAFLTRSALWGLIALLGSVTPALAYDSTDVKLPNTSEQVLCPVIPVLSNPNDCVRVSGRELYREAKTYTDWAGFYSGSYAISKVEALCNTRGQYNVFSGFAALGSRFATGVNITPVDYLDEYKDFYCCKQIVRWVPRGSCDAIR